MTTPRVQRRWYLRLPALLLLIAIGVGQMLLALVFLRNVPSATAEVAAPAGATPGEHPVTKAEHPAPAGHGAQAGHGEHGHESEVDLGNFAMTVPPSKEHATLLVSFHLYGTIQESQHAEFSERYETFEHRIRQEVLLAVRHLNLAALTDPSLTEFKSQLLTRINRVLGHAALGDLIFSDVAILEP
ncbi:MAG TPA: hypothetical protein VG433_03320 [Pirellulales bacterium]|nr:hypothetical protein [Pirellulales bacterium]